MSKVIRLAVQHCAMFLAGALLLSGLAQAQATASAPSSAPAIVPPPALTAVKCPVLESSHSMESKSRGALALGDSIELHLDRPWADFRCNERVGHTIGLFVGDRFFKDLLPLAVPGNDRALRFRLTRTEANQAQWAGIFASMKLMPDASACANQGPDTTVNRIVLAAGYEDGTLAGPTAVACLNMTPRRDDAYGLISLIVIQILFILVTLWLGWKTNLLRDVGFVPAIPRVVPNKENKASFSFARVQMSLWFITTLSAVLFCYAVTGDLSPIPQGVLILMGLGNGTAVAAYAIDANAQPKGSRDVYDAACNLQVTLDNACDAAHVAMHDAATYVAANPNVPPAVPLAIVQSALDAAVQAATANRLCIKTFEARVSTNIIQDVLSDGSASGVALHRLQMLGWTLVYWGIFVITLVHQVTLRDFDATQLTLMGISGVTYLGFKLQESTAPK